MPISHSFYSICDKEKLEQLMNEWMMDENCKELTVMSEGPSHEYMCHWQLRSEHSCDEDSTDQ